MARSKKEQMMGNNAGAPALLPIFDSQLQTTLVPRRAAGSSTPTFTRATTAYVTDFEGLLKPVLSGEARFTGARRVANEFSFSEDFTNAAWATLGTVSKVGNASIVGPDGTTITAMEISFGATAFSGLYQTLPSVAPGTRRISVWVRAKSGSTTLRMLASGSVTSNLTVDETWRRMTAADSAAGTTICPVFNNSTGTTSNVYVYKAQSENVTGQSNQNPSEYVSVGVLSAPYHGAGVDGVKYFSTENGNTVSSNVVTEATGAAISTSTLKGYNAEGARTNLCLQSQTFGTSWTSPGNRVTVTSDQYVAPDGTTTGDRLTATAAGVNAYYIQGAVTTTAVSHTVSVYAKYVNNQWMQIDLYDGTTDFVGSFDLLNGVVGLKHASATTTITSVGNGWYRLTLTATVAASASSLVVFNMSDSNSATFVTWTPAGTEIIALWGAQLEAASFASSYIPTTTVAVTRNADVLTYANSGNVSGTVGSCYSEINLSALNPNQAFVDLASQQYALYNSGSNLIGIFDGTNLTTVAGALSADTAYKVASSWSGAVAIAAKNGSSGTGTFDGSMNIATNMSIGINGSGGANLFGNIKNVKIYARALSAAQLQALTA